MSIYGNLFVQESNTFDLEVFDNFLSEDINFEAMFNESCTINILTEAIDKEAIKKKLKDTWDKIVKKIKELIQKIKDFIRYVKEKVVKIFLKKNKEDAEKALEKDTKPNNESFDYFTEADELDTDITVFNYDTIYRKINNSFADFLGISSIYLNGEYEECCDKIESYETIDDVFDREKHSKYTTVLKTVKECRSWLIENIETTNNITYVNKFVDYLDKVISNLNETLKPLQEMNSYSQSENSVYTVRIKAIGKIIPLASGLLNISNKFIGLYLQDCRRIIRAVNN